MMTLYHYFRSSTSYRTRIALNLKKIDYTPHPINLLKNEQQSKDYLSVNPFGGVPALQDGDFICAQSMAIIDYLEQIKPSPALYPSDSKDRAFVMQIALAVAEDIHPLINLRTQIYLGDHLNASDDDKKAWYRHWTHTGMAAIETLLERHGRSGNCVLGDAPTLADLCLIPHLYSMRRFKVPLDDYPISQRIEKHCIALPAFQNAAPESQPDAMDGLEQIHGPHSQILKN